MIEWGIPITLVTPQGTLLFNSRERDSTENASVVSPSRVVSG